MSNDFTLDDLNRMYEEAMKWQPPGPDNTINDPRVILQNLIASRQSKINQSPDQTR